MQKSGFSRWKSDDTFSSGFSLWKFDDVFPDNNLTSRITNPAGCRERKLEAVHDSGASLSPTDQDLCAVSFF